jgi:hypothetical protein
MFKENTAVLQTKLFGLDTLMSESQNKKIKDSKELYFFNLVVCKINEKDFKPLFSGDYSRPNAPVNLLVGALILKEINNWTFKELFENIEFNLLTKIALGLQDIKEMPFCYTTIFNFKNRIAQYSQLTNINLFEKNFEALTEQQIKQLQLKTNLQRADTTMIDLNIRTYSRLELLIEILIRLHRDLNDNDRLMFAQILSEYTKKSAQKQVYELKSTDLPAKIENISKVYFNLHKQLQSADYVNVESYKNFVRVFTEHFIVVENTIAVKENKELDSSILQSPDAPDATYRTKKQEQHHGLQVFVAETCHPENSLQLITDVAVYQNNVDDTVILNERIETITEKTPNLSELHTDGGFGNSTNDILLETLHINHIQTAVRGRQAEVEITIEKNDNDESYTVSCLSQRIQSQRTKKNFKARFDTKICQSCPLHQMCSIHKKNGNHYFNNDDYLTCKRKNEIFKIPEERRKLRPNVEATVKELVKATNNGKLRVRKTMSVLCYAFNRAIAINLGRIYRYFRPNFCFYANYFSNLVKYLIFCRFLSKNCFRNYFIQPLSFFVTLNDYSFLN